MSAKDIALSYLRFYDTRGHARLRACAEIREKELTKHMLSVEIHSVFTSLCTRPDLKHRERIWRHVRSAGRRNGDDRSDCKLRFRRKEVGKILNRDGVYFFLFGSIQLTEVTAEVKVRIYSYLENMSGNSAGPETGTGRVVAPETSSVYS